MSYPKNRNSKSSGSYQERGASNFRPKSDPKIVKELIRATLSRFGIENQISRYQFILDWEKIVGSEIAKRSKPHALERGVLVLRVVNSEWAQELAFQKQLLLSRLARYATESGDLETSKVTDIRFVVGPN